MHLQELKQIQLYRQHLTAPTDKLTVVHDLCGLQAQFMANALHALHIRSVNYDAATVGEGLVKNWTVRGTVHIFAEDDLPLFIHCDNGQSYRQNDWHGYRFWNQRESWTLSPERQAFFSSLILEALAEGPCTRDALKSICRAAGMNDGEEESMFCAWGGGMRELCERGFCNYVVQEKKAFCLSPEFTPIPEEEANLEILRRYLTHMGPATIHDICYYLKCTQKQAYNRMAKLPVGQLTVQGREVFYLGELPSNCPDIPHCLFLAGFDQLMLAYEKKESIYLPPEYLRKIFNLTGIVMPAILLDGIVSGRWKMTHGKLELYAFRAFSDSEIHSIRDAAEALWSEELNKIEIIT